MTNWVIGQTGELKAAITYRCVPHIVSIAAYSDFSLNQDAYCQGMPSGDIEDSRELSRMSPIASFKNLNTPTLIIHSECDLRCTVEQSEQVFVALQMQGIESRFV